MKGKCSDFGPLLHALRRDEDVLGYGDRPCILYAASHRVDIKASEAQIIARQVWLRAAILANEFRRNHQISDCRDQRRLPRHA